MAMMINNPHFNYHNHVLTTLTAPLLGRQCESLLRKLITRPVICSSQHPVVLWAS